MGGARCRRIATSFVLSLLLPGVAAAQRGANVDRLVVALDPSGFVGLTGSPTPGHLRWELALATGYAHHPLPDAGDAALGRRAFTDVEGELGLGDRAAIALGMGGVWAQAGHGTSGVDAAGLADARVAARYRLLGDVGIGGRPPDGPGLGLDALAYLPTGSRDALSGDGAISGELGATADFHLLGAGAGVRVAWLHRGAARTVVDTRLRDAMSFGAALRAPLPFYTPLRVVLECRGQTDFATSTATPLELDLGLRLHVGSWALMLASGLGLRDAVGAPDARGLLGVRYRPQSHDRDRDGVADGDDECPLLPEDRDGFQDDDGCEDPDNDNDWVPDADDLCPNEEALEGRDADEDGCTDP